MSWCSPSVTRIVRMSVRPFSQNSPRLERSLAFRSDRLRQGRVPPEPGTWTCRGAHLRLHALSGCLSGHSRKTRPGSSAAWRSDRTASDGAEFRLSLERGHVVVLTFGYPHCPDVCPAILAKLAQARAQLGVQIGPPPTGPSSA